MGYNSYETIEGKKYFVVYVDAYKCTTDRKMYLELMHAFGAIKPDNNILDAFNDVIYDQISNEGPFLKVVLNKLTQLNNHNRENLIATIESYKKYCARVYKDGNFVTEFL